jgi:hypothetical protein
MLLGGVLLLFPKEFTTKMANTFYKHMLTKPVQDLPVKLIVMEIFNYLVLEPLEIL